MAARPVFKAKRSTPVAAAKSATASMADEKGEAVPFAIPAIPAIPAGATAVAVAAVAPEMLPSSSSDDEPDGFDAKLSDYDDQSSGDDSGVVPILNTRNAAVDGDGRNRSSRGGLQFDVDLVSRDLRRLGWPLIELEAGVYMTAVIEELCASLLEAAGTLANARHRKVSQRFQLIQPRDLVDAIVSNPELSCLIERVESFPEPGAYGFVCPKPMPDGYPPVNQKSIAIPNPDCSARAGLLATRKALHEAKAAAKASAKAAARKSKHAKSKAKGVKSNGLAAAADAADAKASAELEAGVERAIAAAESASRAADAAARARPYNNAKFPVCLFGNCNREFIRARRRELAEAQSAERFAMPLRKPENFKAATVSAPAAGSGVSPIEPRIVPANLIVPADFCMSLLTARFDGPQSKSAGATAGGDEKSTFGAAVKPNRLRRQRNNLFFSLNKTFPLHGACALGDAAFVRDKLRLMPRSSYWREVCAKCNKPNPNSPAGIAAAAASAAAASAAAATATAGADALIHDEVPCDGCGVNPIVGVRWKCSQCRAFNLCAACEAKPNRASLHNTKHFFTKIDRVKANQTAAEGSSGGGPCTRCESVSYCSARCQHLDWPLHSVVCTPHANSYDVDGVTPLLAAIMHGRTECVKALIDFGVDVTLGFRPTAGAYVIDTVPTAKEAGRSPIHEAVLGNCFEIWDLLISKGAVPPAWPVTSELHRCFVRPYVFSHLPILPVTRVVCEYLFDRSDAGGDSGSDESADENDSAVAGGDGCGQYHKDADGKDLGYCRHYDLLKYMRYQRETGTKSGDTDSNSDDDDATTARREARKYELEQKRIGCGFHFYSDDEADDLSEDERFCEEQTSDYSD